MNNTQGVLEATYSMLYQVEGTIEGKLIYHNGEMIDHEISAGAYYVMMFTDCINDHIKRPGMIAEMKLRPKVFPPITGYWKKKYADMQTEEFAKTLFDLLTSKGTKTALVPNETPDFYERCLYAAYVYVQVDEYLRRPRHDSALDALSTSNGRQLSITHPDYQYALTMRKNNTAYIRRTKGGLSESFRLNQQGQIEVTPDVEGKMKDTLKQNQDAQGFDTALLSQIFTAVYKSQQSITPTTIKIHLPTFCREMGIYMGPTKESADNTPRKTVNDNEANTDILSSLQENQRDKGNDIFSKLKVFQDCMGVLNGSKYYAVLTIIEVDPGENTITFAAPYMNKILMEIAGNPAAKKETKAYQYEIPGYSWLIHSAIVSERNEPAKQLVNRLIAGLMQRGGIPDNKLRQNKGKIGVSDRVTYRVSFKTLVNDAPILKQRIEKGTTSNKNTMLQRAFAGAYALLRTKTDAYKYFLNLSVQEIIPTMTTLDHELIITHNGISAEYGKKIQ